MTQLTLIYLHYPALFYGFIALFSLMVGSFLNVVIYRLPVMMEKQWKKDCREFLIDELKTPVAADEQAFNLMVPRSRCPSCNHLIGAVENIPLISWLIQKGRCKHCHTPIGARYPAIELLTMLLSLVVAYHFGPTFAMLAALLLTWCLISLTFIDIDKMLLPDQITLPLLWVGLLLNINGTFTDLSSAVIGAASGYLALWSLYHLFKLLTGKEGMGYGDFKLLALFGAWFGWQALPLVILLSSFSGAVIGISMMLINRKEGGQPIPFGPYLAIAGWTHLIWGDAIISYYLSHYVY